MPSETVLEIIQLLHDQNIEVILDGGWAVDALLGYQSRSHEDLDIAVFHEDVPAIRALLEGKDYAVVPRDDSWECNFVYGNRDGRLIDFHSCSFDKDRNNIFGVAYTWEALIGKGEISGVPVRCVPADILVEYHTGYPLDENDYHDVRLLCKKFNLTIPPDYNSFRSEDNQLSS